jgi:Tol biopolymer transport system component/DNA-binding winged helix-turn-helix (wHTH) protein
MSLTLKHIYKFDSFVLDVDEQVLLRDGLMVPLTPKVYETLVLLVKHQGSIVTKQTILETLWPDVFVEESNITFNITMLRKALGDTKRPSLYIETVPRRGYRFKTQVRELESDLAPPKPVADVAAPLFERKRTVLFLSGVVLFILAVAAGASWRFNRRLSEREAKGSQVPWSSATALKLEQITTYGNVVCAAISPNGKQAAYVQENSGEQTLWLIQLGTFVNRQLIPPKEGVVYNKVGFSHDGDFVYFITHAENQPSDMYRVPTLNGPPTKLVTDVEGSFSLSSDDRAVVFKRRNRIDREDTLYIANLNNGEERSLVTHKAPDWIGTFSLSPNGKVIAFATGESDSGRQTMNVREVNVETGQEKLLLRPNWYFIWQLDWLPDGQALMLCARETSTTNAQLWRMSYPDGALQRLTNDLNNYLLFSLNADASKIIAVQSALASHIWVSPNMNGTIAKNIADGRGRSAWTPDGRIVYNSASAPGSDLWIAEADGAEPKQLSFNAGVNDWPTISPDNRTIVFQSTRTGVQHLWRMDLDGSNQVQLTNGYAERNAAFSADGKWVYYNSSKDNLLWKVDLNSGQEIKLTDDYAAYPAVSPDGKWIACFHFPALAHEARIAIRSTADMKTVADLTMAPGFWISRSIQWDADSAKVIYAVESKGKVRLYRQSIESGPPQELTTLEGDDEFEFSIASNHRQLAFTSSKWNHDAVLIAGLK